MTVTPTLVVVNARVATGDSRRPWATGIALAGDTLLSVASAAEVRKLATPATRVVDAGGRTLHLPAGTAVGSPVLVRISDDGNITLASPETSGDRMRIIARDE